MNYHKAGETDSSWCYGNESANCATYGRLYNWETSVSVCPSGWHLPSNEEWTVLAKFAGGTGDYGNTGEAGKKLKSTNGWNDYDGVSGNGDDDYGFSALPGGNRDLSSFYSVGNNGIYWTATEYNGTNAYSRSMSNKDVIVFSGWYYKRYARSVRCVGD